ncbi:single-stranded DNA-binding protein [Granulicoccus sp. GXG6511]|uniref:single-stranded DNA-binding protein n=1 Tax=Granulicoccus sp. GXG6511 TaxID=3381351 RepID=UPI003D7E0D00
MEPIVTISGRLGTNVDFSKKDGGLEAASFRMATSRRLFKDGQWSDGPTSWVTVKCFREFATNVSMSLRKGHPVVVTGRLEVEEWVSDQGVQRQTTVIYAHAIGHDLKFCVSTHHRLERNRSEPAPPDGTDADREHGLPEPAHSGRQPDGDEFESAEDFVAGIAERVGSH